MIKRLLCYLFVFSLVFGIAYSDSIWDSTIGSPYSVRKVYKEGDIVMVLIMETTSAVQKSGTDTQNQDNLSLNFSHSLERIYSVVGPSNSIQGAGSNTYKGTGSTSRSNNVLAAVAASVVKILPNGNMKINGSHKVTVNEEMQEIIIDGVVRPKDISSWNTVYSYQIADAQVNVHGRGSIQDAAAPGLLIRLFNLIF